MELLFKGNLPAKAHPHDAGYDLIADIPEMRYIIAPGAFALISTGTYISLPQDYVGLVMPRSGLAARHGVTVLNSPGVIDCGYTGEIKVVLINHGHHEFYVKNGDRIAQLVITRHETPKWVRTLDFDDTVRGADGFGSSGV